MFPVIHLLSFLGVFAPVFSPLVYANLAPPQWHNATPHGGIILTGFAVSADDPGLAFAWGAWPSVRWAGLRAGEDGGTARQWRWRAELAYGDHAARAATRAG